VDGITSGHTKSCGCFSRDNVIARNTTNGLAGHPLHKVHYHMIERCYNPDDKSYKDYGARGIKICDEWLNDFDTFYSWAMDNGWKSNLRMDRIDNDGNYLPINCRFVNGVVSALNQRLLKSSNTSGFRGVSRSKGTRKWVAYITLNWVRHHLGYFKTPIEAAHAYDKKAKELNAGHPLNFN